MRLNEYTSLSEFTNQYIGVWGPSDDHWFGLEFRYNGKDYRLHTGTIHEDDPVVTKDGHEVMFSLYGIQRNTVGHDEFSRIESFASMDDLLKSRCIDNLEFSSIIMDDSTEILAQD